MIRYWSRLAHVRAALFCAAALSLPGSALAAAAAAKPPPAPIPPPGTAEPVHMQAADLWTVPSHLLGDHGTWAFRSIQRVRNGSMEKHDLWNSLLAVREGQATVEFYAALEGSQEVPPGSGEHRGGNPVGAPTRVVNLRSGDVLLIPPRAIYRFVIPEGDPGIRYLQVKLPPP